MAGRISARMLWNARNQTKARLNFKKAMGRASLDTEMFYNIQTVSTSWENVDTGDVTDDLNSYVFVHNIGETGQTLYVGNSAGDGQQLRINPGEFSFFRWNTANNLQLQTGAGSTRVEILIMR